MWMLFLLLVVNAAANDRGWAYYIRLDLSPLYLNIFLMTLLVAFVAALLARRSNVPGLSEARVHPLLRATLVTFVLGTLVGLLGTFGIGSSFIFERKEIGFAVRDYATVPLCIFIGYRLIANRMAAKKFLYAVIVAGVAVSACILLWFRAAASDVSDTTNINDVRTIAFLCDNAGLACILLFYSTAAGKRLLPFWLAAVTAGFCLVGQLAPLTRSNWVAFAAGIMAAIPLISKNNRLRSVFTGLAVSLVLIASLWFAISLASKWTGWDFAQKMEDRVTSLMPWAEDSGYTSKAWDTRVPGLMEELKLWSASPLMGGGFGIQEHLGIDEMYDGIHHNAWTDTLAKAGLVGLLPFLLLFGGCLVVGYRMNREAQDPYLSMMGALGVVTGVYYGVLGMCTWSFNSQRGAICLGLIFGVLLKCRQIQLVEAKDYESLPAAGRQRAYDWNGELSHASNIEPG